MAHSLNIKTEAIHLRKEGNSLKEIAEKLRISKSTASLWLSEIELSAEAQQRLVKKQMLGQYKTTLIRKRKRSEDKHKRNGLAKEMLSQIKLNTNHKKLLCSLLWWCEGNKEFSRVRFTSSDYTLISNFLRLFREAFILDESKFRALIHLHTYHEDIKQKEFWNKITKIPLSQFSKSYQKSHTSKRTKDQYQGCITITYYDARIAKELESIYTMFSSFERVRSEMVSQQSPKLLFQVRVLASPQKLYNIKNTLLLI